jgi:hypothetical protein
LAALLRALIFPVPRVHRVQFVGGHFAVVIRVRLIEECDVALVLRLQLGPTDCPIAVGIQSTQHPAHHRMTKALALALTMSMFMSMPMTMSGTMPARTVVIHRTRRSLGFDDAVGPGFGPAFSSSIGLNFGCLGASPRCQQQSARNHDKNRPTKRQILRISDRYRIDRWLVWD